MKIKLFQLAMTLIAVVVLAGAGIADIQYWQDFEGYDEGYNIKENLPGWGERYGQGTPAVRAGVSVAPGNKSVVTEPAAGTNDYGIILRHLELGVPITDTSAIGLWVMRGPGWESQPDRSGGVQLRFQGAGWEYGLTLTENDLFQYKCDGCGTPSGWTATDIPCEKDTWYRVMWVGTGSSVDLYLDDTLLYSSAGRSNIGAPFDLFLVRHDARIDNVFIADSKADIDEIIAAVKSAGKLTTTWGGIKVK